MTKDKEITKVIFRKFKDGDVIALFPEIPWNHHGWECSSYMRVGQHSGADPNIVYDTKLATYNEYQDLYNELEGLGYNLKVVHAFHHTYYETRKRNAQANRIK